MNQLGLGNGKLESSTKQLEIKEYTWNTGMFGV